jgi:two-component system, chemotaxis family, response regulator Rcp1
MGGDPAVKLLALSLPRRNGREVLEEIKADPHLKVTPVVVLTTSAAERDLLEIYHLHANVYIIEPIALDQFIGIVHAIEGF